MIIQNKKLSFIVPPFNYYNEKYHLLNRYIGAVVIDRTETIKDSGCNIIIEQLIPKVIHSVGDFASICDKTAIDIITKSKVENKPIALTYSGGLDSTSVACALLKRGANILILGSTESIKENPPFYNDVLVNNSQVTLNIDNPLKFLREHPNDYIFVTGECGAHMMGTTRWEESNNLDFFHDVPEEIKPFFFQILDKSPIPIKTDYDAKWWSIFVFKWQYVANRHHLWCGKICNNLFNFFMTEDFQMWALANDNTVKCPNLKEINYKMPIRDYIYSYYQNKASSYDLPKRYSIERTYKNLNYNNTYILNDPKKIGSLKPFTEQIDKQLVI